MRTQVLQSFVISYVLVPLAWILAWRVQINMPLLDYKVPGIYLIFLPAGVRTLAVFLYGLKGVAIITLISGFTIASAFAESESPGYGWDEIFYFAVASPLSAWLMMWLVCHWRGISDSLAGLNMRDLLLIVITQGLISASIKLAIFHQTLFHRTYQEASAADLIEYWLALGTGDVLGSLLVILSVSKLFSTYQKYFARDAR